MFEGNISSLLSSLLSRVFEEKCLTKDNLQSDIYYGALYSLSCAGHIRYSNLEAKKSFLDSLSVPIGLVRGIVGTLEANVSAASIFSNAPLRITVPSFCPRNL